MLFPNAAIAAALVAKLEIIGNRTWEKTNQSNGFGSQGQPKLFLELNQENLANFYPGSSPIRIDH